MNLQTLHTRLGKIIKQMAASERTLAPRVTLAYRETCRCVQGEELPENLQNHLDDLHRLAPSFPNSCLQADSLTKPRARRLAQTIVELYGELQTLRAPSHTGHGFRTERKSAEHNSSKRET